jgi:hypothetical protein
LFINPTQESIKDSDQVTSREWVDSS